MIWCAQQPADEGRHGLFWDVFDLHSGMEPIWRQSMVACRVGRRKAGAARVTGRVKHGWMGVP